MDKKRILLLVILVSVVSLTIFIIATSETLIVTVDDINTTAGFTNVSVPVSLDNNVTVYGLELGISHHPYLIFKNISLSSRINNSIIEFNDVDGEILIATVLEEGIQPGNGTILTLMFDISSLALGDYTLNSTDISAADIDTSFYNIQFNPGNVHVS